MATMRWEITHVHLHLGTNLPLFFPNAYADPDLALMATYMRVEKDVD